MLIIAVVELLTERPTVDNDVPSFTEEQLREHKQQQDVKRISAHYKVSEQFAADVVHLAYKYGNDDSFPKPRDILAIISIESSFRPHVKSNLKRDKAVGLTQIRPRVWRHWIKPGELSSIENQVKYSSKILTHYFNVTGSVESAINAYNVGLTAHLRGDRNHRYVAKYSEALARFVRG